MVAAMHEVNIPPRRGFGIAASPGFCGFLQRCVSSVDAAELLLLLHKEPDRWWDASDLSTQLEPGASLSEADVHRYVDAFQQCSVVVRDAERRIQYRRAPAHDEHLTRLARNRHMAIVNGVEGTAQQAYRGHSHLTGAAQRITRLSR